MVDEYEGGGGAAVKDFHVPVVLECFLPREVAWYGHSLGNLWGYNGERIAARGREIRRMATQV